jgi:DNA-directed RNA polymerase subunit M/transcription elongation factor TFIIS
MSDIFDNKILCKKCNTAMQKTKIAKNGFIFRAVVCPKCNEKIIHPLDEQEYSKFINLKNKEFKVKMRLVGNSYAVSIPKEIVSFIREQEKIMSNIVRLCFEDMGRLSLNFGDENLNSSEQNGNSRVVKAHEAGVVKNGKPVLHSKQFYDSAYPEKNQNRIYRSDE